MKIKTIDVNAKEWFDKANGNSYFSATVTINYGMKNAKEIRLPFQYGYGEHYLDLAAQALEENKLLPFAIANRPLWRYCKDNNIILRASKKENCLKRELV